MNGAAIMWFRNDLRVADNPALAAAAASGHPLICLYIHDEETPGLRRLGGAARWWLHGSLAALASSLEKRGASLTIVRGAAEAIFAALLESRALRSAFWNRRYDTAGVATDARIKARLKDNDVSCQSFNGSLLHEPWETATAAGTPMRVFGPFWRAAQAKGDPAAPTPAPRKLKGATWRNVKNVAAVSLSSLQLQPSKPNWAKAFPTRWTPGEDGARERIADFIDEALHGYAAARDRPDKDGSSRLSPHLRFGEISPRQIWHSIVQKRLSQTDAAPASDAAKFLTELGWREFSYHLLFHNPELATKNFQPRFDRFPWRASEEHLNAWRKGLTGYPIVDAGMRQLWSIGWMHNRVRMIAASFLIKHLLIDWRDGEQWFWDTLVDADPANNPASWQWVAGTGADAAPYFRVFNPTLQGEKFDPGGVYVREWVPELSALPNDLIHRPWAATAEELRAADIALGETYPKPIVDHAAARARALSALSSIKLAD